MKFGSREVGCWGGDRYIKFKFVSSHCESHYVCLFLVGLNVADNAAICDLGALGDFMNVNEKQVLVPCMYSSPWKNNLVSFGMPLIHFNLSRTYYWDFPVLGQMTVFTLPGCNIRFPASCSINAQSSTSGHTGGAGLLGAEVGVLIFSKCFSMRSCTWRQRAWVLYLCTCDPLGVSVAFLCSVGIIDSVSLEMMWSVN